LRTLRKLILLSREKEIHELHIPTILCGDFLCAIGSWDQSFCLERRAHGKSNGLSLLVSFQKISIARGGAIVASLHRAHRATASSALFFGSWHLYYLFMKMNHGVGDHGRGVWGNEVSPQN